MSSYGLVLGKAGLPKLEVTGLALALIITKVAMLIIKTSYVFMRRLTQQYQFYQGSPCIDCSYLKKMFIKGIQIGVQGVFDSVSPTVMTTLLGTKGTRGLIAMQASSPFSMMIMIPNFYLSQQVNVLISKAVGQKDQEKVKVLLKFALLVI